MQYKACIIVKKGGIDMHILKNLEFDRTCKKAAAAIGVCVVVLILCGAFRDNAAALVTGDIAACAVVSLYACMFVYAACNALAKEVSGYWEFVLRSGHIICASCAAAQAVKLFFLLLCPGVELAGGVILIADAAVSWIFPMMVLKGRRIAFLERFEEDTTQSTIIDKKIFGPY